MDVSESVWSERVEASHSATIETVLERHKCPGLSSSLGDGQGPD